MKKLVLLLLASTGFLFPLFSQVDNVIEESEGVPLESLTLKKDQVPKAIVDAVTSEASTDFVALSDRLVELDGKGANIERLLTAGVGINAVCFCRLVGLIRKINSVVGLALIVPLEKYDFFEFIWLVKFEDQFLWHTARIQFSNPDGQPT